MREYYIIVGWYTRGPSAYKPFSSMLYHDKDIVIGIGELYQSVGTEFEIITVSLPAMPERTAAPSGPVFERNY